MKKTIAEMGKDIKKIAKEKDKLAKDFAAKTKAIADARDKAVQESERQKKQISAMNKMKCY